MDSLIERKQTTQGIDYQYSQRENLLILDTEGLDSREKW